MKLKVGDFAPAFVLPNQRGEMISLAEYLGRWVLLYFYPQDDTPGCTKEACNFRNHLPKFERSGLAVLGVSADSVASHEEFTLKYDLTFPLLADTKKEVVRLYGVWGEKKFLGKFFQGVQRHSFLIDPAGRIVKIYEQVKPAIHATEVECDLKELQAAA
jgi:peroxiredoxin Q/BCP